MSRLVKPEPASLRVREEWGLRVEAEYRSAAYTQHFVLWLMQLGAPPGLLADGLRVVRDELAHARLSHEVLRAAGGMSLPAIDRATLELRRSAQSLEHDVLRVALETYCLGETVAVRLFAAMRDGATEKSAKKALDRILRDEVRHRDFGFDVLDVLLETVEGAALRSAAEQMLPAMIASVRAAYAPESIATEATFPIADRAFGLIPGAMYVEAVEATIRKDYVPRFAKRGIAIGG
jgi:hypothetical protein